MKIAELHIHVLEAPLKQPFLWSFNRADSRGACLVEIVADDGTLGWGECFGPPWLNAAMVEAFRPHLIGSDPLAIEEIWGRLYNHFRDQGQRGIHVTALAGVDIALWDLKGRVLGQPIHVLLGGPLRRSVQAYATGTYRREAGDPLDYVVEEVKGYVAEGFGAVKLKIGFDVEEDAALVRAVRAALGPERGLMLDANHGYDALDAIRLGQRVEDCDIGWLEEPVVPEDLDSYVEVRGGQSIPVAGGETLFTRYDFAEVMRRRAMDIVQPDTCAAGGLSECKKIADMAWTFGVRYVPHVWGTGIGLAAALQLLAVLPHAPPTHRQRQPMLELDRSEHPFRQAVLTEPIEHEQGTVAIPDGPGLGIAVDREALKRFAAP